MVKETRRPKPTTISVSEELGFPQHSLPEIGPGSHKPNLGRGGLSLPSEYYFLMMILKFQLKRVKELAKK